MGMSGLMGIELLYVVLEGGRGCQTTAHRDLQLDFPRRPTRPQANWSDWRVLGLSTASLDLPLLIFAEVPVLHFPDFPGYRNRGGVESWPMTWKSD